MNELLRLSRSSYSFQATVATCALGDIGDAANFVVLEIAELMTSEDKYIRREAARSLAKLGPIAEPALDILIQKVANDSPSDDSTWFAAEAIGAIGPSGRRALPLLRRKIGMGAIQFDDSLRQAIQDLEMSEKLKADGDHD